MSKNILTPVDFSVNSVQAFDYAVQYSKQHKAVLHLLHVVDPSFHDQGYNLNNQIIMQERLRNANEELKKFVNEIPHPGVNVAVCLKVGIPEEEILHYTNQNDIGVIIISSHGWTAKYHLTTGRVADYIIENAQVPVICLRAEKSHGRKINSVINNSLAENWVG